MNFIKKILTTFVITSFVLPVAVSSANVNVTVTSNLSTAVVGNQVNVTFKLSSSASLGSWNYQINYNASLFNFKSCSNGQALTQVGVITNNSTKSTSVTCYFTAAKAGTGTFSIKNADILDFDENKMGIVTSSKNVTVITKAQQEASYSKNNNLKALSVSDYEIVPGFKSDVLEYSLELPNDIRNITINATKEDNTASIDGAGAKTLEEGLNSFAIVVSAQNGTKKTYKLNITVLELEPILVDIGEKEYSVVRKKDLIEAPNIFYKETIITIDEKEVPAFVNENINYTLVGLKDADNNILLYVYNKDDGTYREYNEEKFSQLVLEVLNEEQEVSTSYKKTIVTIGSKDYTGYKLNKNSKYALIYALNIETGDKNFYVYDSKEGTIQRYNDEEITLLNKQHKETKSFYEYIIIGLGIFLTLTYLILLISLIRKEAKRKKKRLSLEATMDLNSVSHLVEIEKIEKPKKDRTKKEIEVIIEENELINDEVNNLENEKEIASENSDKITKKKKKK